MSVRQSPDRPAPARGQGQWALGHREPLNAAERAKRDSDGLEVRQRIIERYSKTGFAGIDPTDLRSRFRWFGLYTQRAPGIPGGRTATVAPEDLEDEYFMLRVRIDGGRLDGRQLAEIGALAARYGRDVADITDRQNIQLHWIRIEDVPAIWERLAAVGLTTTEACGDTPRVMLGCPLAGITAAEVVDGSAALAETATRYVGDPQFSNLPRKFKTSISGCAEHCTHHEINDVSFVGVRGPRGEPGFDLWVGGGLSTNPMFARRLGAFVPADRVPDVWAGVTGLFRDYGYRRSRTHARLKFLVADWGVERFRTVLEEEYLKEPLPDGPPPAPPVHPQRDHIGPTPQHDGRIALGCAPSAGRVSGTLLRQVAALAARYGSDRVRTTAQQKLVVLDVPADRVDALAGELQGLDLPTDPAPFRRGTMACTGLEFCKLAIVETKARADALHRELDRRLAGVAEPLSVHVNGCPNSCARFQTADVGLKGSMVPGPDGGLVEGFQVHLGGQLGARDGEQPAFGRKFRGLKLTADEAPDYVERLVRGYLARRAPGESFAGYARRAEEGWLA